MINDLHWFFIGFFLITLGECHEMLLYWLQLRKRWYSKTFGTHGFYIHAIQLGGVWIGIGSGLCILFYYMPHSPFHDSIIFHLGGITFFVIGIGLMWLSTWTLGWKRVMKVRLFLEVDPPWVTHGIFRYLNDPMYLGSQIAMGGLALALNSWYLLIYMVYMYVLQSLLARLEKR